MSVNRISALNNGHFGPLRSVYALSEAVIRSARFFARTGCSINQTPRTKKSFFKRTKRSLWTEQAISIHLGLLVFELNRFIPLHFLKGRNDASRYL